MEAIMYSLVVILGYLGYGCGYEGYENGKYYFGIYTPSREYGWVLTEKEIYLDVILEKTSVQY
jgi:hypothetical protein